MDFKQEDRDLLIKHDVKLNQVCEAITEVKDRSKDMNKDMNDGFDKIVSKFDENTSGCANNRVDCRKEVDEKFVSRKILIWILTIVVGGVISVAAYTGGLSTKVAVNSQKVEVNSDKIELFHGKK